MAYSSRETVPSGDYLYPNTCAAEDVDHEIRADAVDLCKNVVATLDDYGNGIPAEFGAAGCNSCFSPDEDVYLYWVAQNDGSESIHLGYGSTSDSLTDDDLIGLLADEAERMGVPYSRPPSSDYKFAIGEPDAYTTLTPGARVSRRRGSRVKSGTVLDPSLLRTDDTEYEVFEQAGVGGDVIARFDDRDTAKVFAESAGDTEDEYSVRLQLRIGERPGSAVVIFDGEETPTEVAVKRLDYPADAVEDPEDD